MDASRWAVMYLLLVVGGGAILAADTVFDFTVSIGDYTVPFGLTIGFSFLVGGMFRLIKIAERRRTRVVGWFGLIVSVLIFVVDGFTITGSLVYYGGVAVLVVTGVVLFVLNSEFDQRSAKA